MIHGNHREMGEAQYMPSDMRMVQLSFHCATEYELGEAPKASDAAITLGVPYSTSVSEVALLLRNELRASHGGSLLHWFNISEKDTRSPPSLFVTSESLGHATSIVLPFAPHNETFERLGTLEGLLPLTPTQLIGEVAASSESGRGDMPVTLYYANGEKYGCLALCALCAACCACCACCMAADAAASSTPASNRPHQKPNANLNNCSNEGPSYNSGQGGCNPGQGGGYNSGQGGYAINSYGVPPQNGQPVYTQPQYQPPPPQPQPGYGQAYYPAAPPPAAAPVPAQYAPVAPL